MSELVPSQVSLDKQIACVEREIKLRERCYPRWVQQHKMTAAKMDEELAAMRAVRATLEAVKITARLL